MASAVLLPMATPSPAKASISRSFTLSPKATIWDGTIPRRRPRVSRAAALDVSGPTTSIAPPEVNWFLEKITRHRGRDSVGPSWAGGSSRGAGRGAR